jgi:hypothetical protein
MNLGKMLFLLLVLTIMLTMTIFGQRYAVTNGNWDGAIWASTPGGVAGSASTPTSADNVIINAGITVTVNNATAECHSVSFGDKLSSFSLDPASILSVYGNFTIADTLQKAFTTWSPGAKLRFAGSESQVLSGWSRALHSSDSTILMEVEVEKTGDSVKTPGNDMKLGIGTSLHIKSGNFVLGYRDDLNGRTLEGSTQPTIQVDSGGVFKMNGSLSSIRSGVSGNSPIGKITVKGTAYFSTTSSIGISFNGVDVINGGNLRLESFSSTSPRNVKLDTVNVYEGATIWNGSTINFWDSLGVTVVNLDTGGVYKVTTATTNFPINFTNHGTVRYQRTTGDSSQTIVNMNYYRLEVSFGGTKTWTLNGDYTIQDSLEINNSANFVLTALSEQRLTVNNVLRLTSGQINNSDGNITLALADGATVSRATGKILAPPSFGSSVNVRYTSLVSSVTTGPEIPASTTVLQDFQIICDTTTVTLNSPATVNGTLTLSNGKLDNSSNMLTLANGATIRRATGELLAAPAFAGLINVYYISSVASVTTGFELPTSSSTLNNLTIICDTNSVTLNAPVTVNGTLTLSNGILDNSLNALTIASGKAIRRATAELTSAPVFAGTVDVAYISVVGSVATGPELPTSLTTLRKLTMESPKNVTLESNVTVTDTLEILRGLLYLGDNSITIGASGYVTGVPADTAMFVMNGEGTLKKMISTVPASLFFPIGDTARGIDYSPVSVEIASGTLSSGAYLIAKTVNAKHPENTTTSNYLNRYWIITPSGITNYTSNLQLGYSQNDVVGDENQIALGLWDGSTWTSYYPAADIINNILQVNDISLLKEFTGVSSPGSYNMMAGWNLLSVPFEAPTMTKIALFPTAESQAFAYEGSYVNKDTLNSGTGYWLKFLEATQISMQGFPTVIETVDVAAGWNIIGSIGIQIPKNSVLALGTSILSNMFYYDGTYKSADSIKVGLGYWVKVSAAGMLILSNGGAFNQLKPVQEINETEAERLFNSLKFNDASGREQVLYFGNNLTKVNLDKYELPPVPPADQDLGYFDVRFGSNRYLEIISQNGSYSMPISINANAYPVKLSIGLKNILVDRSVYLKIGERIISLDGNREISIGRGSGPVSLIMKDQSKVVPERYSLDQNYPNPFNPSTSIHYGIPENGYVRLDIYNLLGQKVETLVDASQEAGYYNVDWNASNVSSGIYLYKLSFHGEKGNTESQMRRMSFVR